MSKTYVIDDNKSLEMSRDYNNRLYEVEDDEMTMTFIRTGSGQKIGKSVYVGPKPKYPLIRQSGEKQNSLRLAPISSEDLSTALSGITLNADQNALVELNLILRNMGKNLIEMDPIMHLLI